ncbi:MAG: hypothetical protein F4Z21_07410, partial [Acidobacteria bacterium]|nr:hypothetical protein [Acidobacteriota bacterium]
MKFNRLNSLVAGVAVLVLAFPVVGIPQALPLGSERQLFVDRYLVDRLEGLELRLQQPRPENIAIEYDQPWEDRLAFYTTVVKDGDVYRMYYRCRLTRPRLTCYAESRDGIHWTKPQLGLVEVDGSTANNVILPVAGQFCAFLDGRPGVPRSERLKANARDVGTPYSLVGYVSADGVRWRKIREAPLVDYAMENNFDSQNVIFWSEAEQRYVLYARHMVEGRRATARATSRDFLQWSPQTLMTYSDTGTTRPSQHLYTNQTQPYFRAPQIYIALPARIHFGRRLLTPEELQFLELRHNRISGGMRDVSDSVLLSSRPGSTRYDFTFKESFLRPGLGQSNWSTRTNYPGLGVVQTGPAEMSLYVQRDYGQSTAHLQRMSLRLDGFASQHAPYHGGEMVTRPITFEGSRLEINYSTSAAGSIRVEIQTADGKPIPGFSLAECPEIIGDEISRIVAWGEVPPPLSTGRDPESTRAE